MVKTREKDHHNRILHIPVSLGIKFQLKPITLISWTKFAQNGYFWYKTEKVSTAIEFFIFELV